MSEQFDIEQEKTDATVYLIDVSENDYNKHNIIHVSKVLITYLTNTTYIYKLSQPESFGLYGLKHDIYNNIISCNSLTKIAIYGAVYLEYEEDEEKILTYSYNNIYKCKLYCDKIGYKMLIFLVGSHYLNIDIVNACILLNIDLSDVYYMDKTFIIYFIDSLHQEVCCYYITNKKVQDLVNFLSTFNKFTNIPNVLSEYMVIFDKFRIYFKYGIEETSLKVLIKEYANNINPDEDLKITIKEIWDYIQLLANNIPDFKQTTSYYKYYGKVSQYNENDKEYISKTLHSSFEPMIMDKVNSLKDDKTITYYKITNLEYKEVNKEVEPFYSSVEKSVPVYTSKLKHYICLMFDNVIKDDKYYKE